MRPTHYWDINHGESSNSEGGLPSGQNNLSDTNFFECREVTNCEFIYE
jgi:hypothetical protein